MPSTSTRREPHTNNAPPNFSFKKNRRHRSSTCTHLLLERGLLRGPLLPLRYTPPLLQHDGHTQRTHTTGTYVGGQGTHTTLTAGQMGCVLAGHGWGGGEARWEEGTAGRLYHGTGCTHHLPAPPPYASPRLLVVEPPPAPRFEPARTRAAGGQDRTKEDRAYPGEETGGSPRCVRH